LMVLRPTMMLRAPFGALQETRAESRLIHVAARGIVESFAQKRRAQAFLAPRPPFAQRLDKPGAIPAFVDFQQCGHFHPLNYFHIIQPNPLDGIPQGLFYESAQSSARTLKGR